MDNVEITCDGMSIDNAYEKNEHTYSQVNTSTLDLLIKAFDYSNDHLEIDVLGDVNDVDRSVYDFADDYMNVLNDEEMVPNISLDDMKLQHEENIMAVKDKPLMLACLDTVKEGWLQDYVSNIREPDIDWAMASRHFLPFILGGSMPDYYSNSVRYRVPSRDVEKETMVENNEEKLATTAYLVSKRAWGFTEQGLSQQPLTFGDPVQTALAYRESMLQYFWKHKAEAQKIVLMDEDPCRDIFTEFEKVLRLFNGAVATYPYTILATRADCAIKLLGQTISTTPEWEPKKGGLKEFNGQHALRERAKKIDQGILVIWFEMPYNIWCGDCNSMILKGVRFNTDSTKIVIQTNPKNCEYLVISEAQKKYEDFDNEDIETMALHVEEGEHTIHCYSFSSHNATFPWPPSPSSFPSAFRQLISRFWSGKPERRPGFDEIVSILERYAERVEEDPNLLKCQDDCYGQTGNQSLPIPPGALAPVPRRAAPIPDSLYSIFEFLDCMEKALSHNGNNLTLFVSL
ncbi:coiled-coil domain-containing protein 130-like protein [Tanacetum coccineum]